SLFVSPDSETWATRGSDPQKVYDYTRVANPTTDILQTKLAALEKTEACRCFGSGNAAVTNAVMHCVKAGDHVVAVEPVYGPTRSFLLDYLPRFGVETTFVPGMETQQFADAIQRNTRVIYLESPSTLVFNLQNLSEVSALAKERGITTIIDNSWSSPYFQNPTDFGI